MDTLQIQKDAAIQAHENAKSSGKKLLEDLFGKKTFLKDVTERIKTPEDAISELGENDIDVIDYRKLIKAGVSEHLINYQLAIVLVKAINEGWEPNWDDPNEKKWQLWFKMSSSGFRYYDFDYWITTSYVGSRLCLREKRLGNYLGNQFPEVFKNFMLIKK